MDLFFEIAGWICLSVQPLCARFQMPDPFNPREALHAAAPQPHLNLSNSAAGTNSALRSRLVTESSKRIKFWNNIRWVVRLWPALLPQFWRNRWLNGPGSGLMGTFTSAWPASCPRGWTVVTHAGGRKGRPTQTQQNPCSNGAGEANVINSRWRELTELAFFFKLHYC